MRNAKEGVALAAIVAKETTEGKWSGTGGGLGFGTGGLGLFVGGMSGTKREQSQRAKEFEAPPKASFNWLYVFAPLILLLGIAAMFGFGSSFVQFMSDGQSAATGSLGRAQEGLGQMVSILGRFVPLLAIVGAALWFIFGRSNREDEENARFKAAEAADRIKEGIYYRLRYVEADHVVFDPKTGREVPAERNHILSLLNELASSEQAE
ncbi:hypothetical protein GJ973_21300 [Salmonella enterica]|nr:hypothetical protein [Salmonella enterica]